MSDDAFQQTFDGSTPIQSAINVLSLIDENNVARITVRVQPVEDDANGDCAETTAPEPPSTDEGGERSTREPEQTVAQTNAPEDAFRPGTRIHQVLYLLATYEHEHEAGPTSHELADEYSDVFESVGVLHGPLADLDRQFNLTNRRLRRGEGIKEHFINDRGIDYLKAHGVPEGGKYTVPEEYQR